MTDDSRIARLKARLALPERDADEAFVTRTALALRALALERSDAKARREQALNEIFAVAALGLAAHQLLPVGEAGAELLVPLASATGAMAAAWALGSLLLSLLAGTGLQRRAADR